MIIKNTLKSVVCTIFIASAFFMLITSCEKVPGHFIATTVVKAGTVQYILKDTTRTLSTTTADTVFFNSTTAPVTTIQANNGQKTLNFTLTFNANTIGTFPVNTLALKIPQASGYFTYNSQGVGKVTVSSINVNTGLITGSFTSTVHFSKVDTTGQTITGIFNIQQ